jgi:adenylate cyclase
VSTDPLIEARAALTRGDALVAYDLARTASIDDPDNLDARYLVALSLARSGAAEQAGSEAADLQQRVDASGTASQELREDADALVARLAKDEALRELGPARAAGARAAALLYEAAAERYGRYYSCVNAASLWLLAGDEPRARGLAERARTLAHAAGDEDDRYWRLASDAEAALVLGDEASARTALQAAAAVEPVDLGARAVTRRQLRLVCEARDLSTELVDALEVPSVVHYCGHLTSGDARAQRALDEVAAAVVEFLDRRKVGFAYGSLAGGADIVVAELLLEREIELHVVLPFGVEEFEITSVAPAGMQWLSRFQSCLSRAASVTFASDSAFSGDDELFTYCARIAMGHALNRAEMLDARAEQLAVWDEQPSTTVAGTSRDVEAWRRSGHTTHVIPFAARQPATPSVSKPDSARQVQAILFTDLRGFSALRDEHFPIYIHEVLGALARIFERHRESLSGYKSWGDATQTVFSDVGVAARCALELQEAVQAIDTTRLGLPIDLAMRVGAHVGRVVHLEEPFTHEPTFWGREFTRAARIEPRTPEGSVYVTDAFAALLALEPESDVRCDYVGRITTAKEFETIPMYRLRHA